MSASGPGAESSSSSSLDTEEYASADEHGDDSSASDEDCKNVSGQVFSPGGLLSTSPRTGSGGVGATTTPGDHQRTPQNRGYVKRTGGGGVHSQGKEADVDTTPLQDRQELELDPHTFRDLDIGADVQLCKLYYINDLVSGAEWVVDGYVEADASVDAVWQEKRVKDSKTGSIISLQELEELLMARVLAQFEAHKVRDLDTGEVVDLFAGVSRASVMDSIQKDLRVHDKDSGLMLSLLDLRDVLVPSVHVPSAKKGKHRRLKLKGKHVRRMAAKVATGLQAGMAGMQWKDSNNTQGYHSQPPGSTADGDGMVPGQGVKVQVHKKQMKELSELRILQKVEAHDGLIWAMKFSPDGLYLASGGQDKTVSVWEVVPGAKSSRTDRHSSARVAVRPRAYRRFPGHEADILDIAWSPSGFVLSSSMDRTVRLW